MPTFELTYGFLGKDEVTMSTLDILVKKKVDFRLLFGAEEKADRLVPWGSMYFGVFLGRESLELHVPAAPALETGNGETKCGGISIDQSPQTRGADWSLDHGSLPK